MVWHATLVVYSLRRFFWRRFFWRLFYQRIHRDDERSFFPRVSTDIVKSLRVGYLSHLDVKHEL